MDIIHKSGDVLRIRVYEIDYEAGRLNLVFDDAARNFEIQRPERKIVPARVARSLA